MIPSKREPGSETAGEKGKKVRTTSDDVGGKSVRSLSPKRIDGSKTTQGNLRSGQVLGPHHLIAAERVRDIEVY